MKLFDLPVITKCRSHGKGRDSTASRCDPAVPVRLQLLRHEVTRKHTRLTYLNQGTPCLYVVLDVSGPLSCVPYESWWRSLGGPAVTASGRDVIPGSMAPSKWPTSYLVCCVAHGVRPRPFSSKESLLFSTGALERVSHINDPQSVHEPDVKNNHLTRLWQHLSHALLRILKESRMEPVRGCV